MTPGNTNLLPARSSVADLARDLRELRRNAGLTQKDVALLCHYSVPAVSGALNGRRLPPWPLVAAYLSACGVHDEDLWRMRWDATRAAVGSARQLPNDVASQSSDDFHAALRQLWSAAGGPSLRELERRGRGYLARSTLSDALAGRHVPAWSTTQVLLVCLGDGDFATWRRRWSAAAEPRRRGGRRRPRQPRTDRHEMTDRQRQVIDLLRSGATNRQIAEHLGITENTVKVHVSAILRKLRVTTRGEAVAAVARGMGVASSIPVLEVVSPVGSRSVRGRHRPC